MMDRPAFILSCVLSVLVPALGAVPVRAQEKSAPQVVLKMGTLAPEGSTWMDILRNIVYMTEKRGGGRVKTIIYGGGVMGDEPDMVRKMRLDQLQMGGFTVHGISAIAPEMSVLELPFLFDSLEEVDLIREKFMPEFEKFFEKRGFILLAVVDQGFVHIYTNQPVRTPEELGRQKMWVWAEEPVATATFNALGLEARPLPVPEVLSGLQTGLINAVYTSPLACLALQWFNHIKYLIDINLRYEPGVVAMTKKAWDLLTPLDRKVIKDTNRKYMPGALAAIRKDQKRSFDAIIESGAKQVTLTPQERDEFRKKSRVIRMELAGKLYPRKLLEDIEKTLE